ncbi:MAG TPA: hypothetical protein VGP64_03130 [Polyangia bacterium]|jgi:hypothetical protein
MFFEVEWTSEAWSGIRALSALERRPLLEAAAALARRAEAVTRDRRPVAGRLGRPPDPIWEARVRRQDLLLYCVTGPRGDDSRCCAQILRVVIGCPPGPLVLTAAELRELERRRRSLWKLGGGIPHEVVRRAWLAELAQDVS